MGYNPIKIQASNKIDFRLLIFIKKRDGYFRNSLPLYLT